MRTQSSYMKYWCVWKGEQRRKPPRPPRLNKEKRGGNTKTGFINVSTRYLVLNSAVTRNSRSRTFIAVVNLCAWLDDRRRLHYKSWLLSRWRPKICFAVKIITQLLFGHKTEDIESGSNALLLLLYWSVIVSCCTPPAHKREYIRIRVQTQIRYTGRCVVYSYYRSSTCQVLS